MQIFKDTATGAFWQFDDDVDVNSSEGYLAFNGPVGTLWTPRTLVPAVLSNRGELPAPVPESVSRYQGREAMRLMRFPRTNLPDWTLFDAFEALLEDSATPAYYRRAWHELLVFERTSAMLNASAEVLGLTSDRVDDLFRLAATLKA